MTVKFVQHLTGTLNFLNKAIVPGRAFTRGMYTKLKITNKNGEMLKQHHHILLKKQFLLDCEMWRDFLINPQKFGSALFRPFIDVNQEWQTVKNLAFFTDSSLNADLGCGGVFGLRWFATKWDQKFIIDCKPSIAFLELFALTAGVLHPYRRQYFS